MATGKRRGADRKKKVTSASPTKDQKDISASKLTDEDIEELSGKGF